MSIKIHMRFVYDDVALILSTSPDATRWLLEIRDFEGSWLPITPQLIDDRLSVSTPNLTLWDRLRAADVQVAERVFRNPEGAIRFRFPFSVMWDVSNWWYGTHDLLRFTDPDGEVHEFTDINDLDCC
ncbi:MAG: hypothetical protein WBA98_13525 [Gordonia sp. (in: high G+C Gram-positive bacteria)]|uniref:hypothetical protein n=1 Tax=Gordonia sp. (in: high G+C Gram-positive bacteria) TaxID=84139 RepID=UPI003C75F18B